MTREEVYRNSIRKGIRLLDERGPEDWRGQINLNELNIGCSYSCVLGQVYGYYGTGMDSLGIYGWNAKTYGFDTPFSHRSLTRYWKDELAHSA